MGQLFCFKREGYGGWARLVPRGVKRNRGK